MAQKEFLLSHCVLDRMLTGAHEIVENNDTVKTLL